MAKYTHSISSTNCDNITEKNYKEYIQHVQKRMHLILENPVIQEFLKDEEHEKLMKDTFENPSPTNINLLNHIFQKFYRINRVERYSSALIRGRSQDYDKKRNKRERREHVILDKPASMGERDEIDTLGSLWEGKEATEVESFDSIIDQKDGILPVENEHLEKAIRTLNDKQHKILYYRYQKQLTNREVAELLGETEQNIGYWVKKTLKQLRDSL